MRDEDLGVVSMNVNRRMGVPREWSVEEKPSLNWYNGGQFYCGGSIIQRLREKREIQKNKKKKPRWKNAMEVKQTKTLKKEEETVEKE